LYLDRIETIDKNGLELHSIIEVNSEAIAIAKTMDAEMKGKSRGPYTVPVVIKDNIDTADKMQTTAGSLALEGNFASKDAFV
jgi:amidase